MEWIKDHLNRKSLKEVDRFFDFTERFFITQLLRLSTYLGPAVPAYFVFESAMDHLTDGWSVAAGFIAFALELLGLGAISNLLQTQEWNRRREESQHIPTRSRWMLVWIYTFQIVLIVFGLKASPENMLWLALLALSSLSLTTGFSYTQNQQLKALIEDEEDVIEIQQSENHRKLEIESEELERKRKQQDAEFELELEIKRAREVAKIERQNAKAGVQSTVQSVQPNLDTGQSENVQKDVSTSGDGQLDTVQDTQFDDLFLDTIVQFGWSPTKIAEQLKISRSSVYNHKERLIKEKRLYENGTVKIAA